MTIDRPPWLMRVVGESGQVCGAAIVLDSWHAISCAHLVSGSARLELPFGGGAWRIGTSVPDGYFPVAADGSGDVAVLRFDRPLDGEVTPAPFLILPEYAGRSVVIRGFPRGQASGAIAYGVLGGFTGGQGEWVQIDPQRSRGWAIEKGFSGGPVWDEQAQAVVGIVVARDAYDTGHMLPTSYLQQLWSRLPVSEFAQPKAYGPSGGARGATYGDSGSQPLGAHRDRLDDVYYDPTSLFEASDLGRFSGRTWITGTLSHFLESETSGFFLIDSEAGIGKTTYAAWLSRTYGYPAHFAGLDGNRSAVVARKNLAVQIIRQWNLLDFTADGALSPAAARRDWFEQVLWSAARRRDETEPTRPIVLVIDGIEEIREFELEDGIGLPAALPPGVFVVATCRTGNTLANVWKPCRAVTIVPGSPENLRDMRAYLARALEEPILLKSIIAADMNVPAVLDALMERCNGVWIYLRFVLEEFRQGLRSVKDVQSLPNSLWTYYTQNIHHLRIDETAWDSCYLPVLAALAVAEEPLPVEIINRFAHGAGSGRVYRFLSGRFRPFCQVVAVDGQERYRVYHASLKEFLGGVVPPEREGLGNLPLELNGAARRAHSAIADHYLDAWGGLSLGLPALAASPAPAHADGGYGVRHIVHHLLAADRGADVHQLMDVRTVSTMPAGMPRTRQLWFVLHDHLGDHDGYLRDVDRAKSHATSSASPREPHYVGLAVLYALIHATFNSITESISDQFAAVLVRAGVWSTSQAFTYARRMPRPTNRARAFHRIAGVLVDPDRSHALANAVEAALSAELGADQTAVILALIDSLDVAITRKVLLPFALRHPQPGHRVVLVDSILTCMPCEDRTELAEAIFRQHRDGLNGKDAAQTIIAIAPYLSRESAMQAGEVVRRLGDSDAHAAMAVALSRFLGWSEDARTIPMTGVLVARRKVDQAAAVDLLMQMAGRSPETTTKTIAGAADRLHGDPHWPLVVQQAILRGPTSWAIDTLRAMFPQGGTQAMIATLERMAPILAKESVLALLADLEESDPHVRTQAMLAIASVVSAFEPGGREVTASTTRELQNHVVLRYLGRPELNNSQTQFVRRVLAMSTTVNDHALRERTVQMLNGADTTPVPGADLGWLPQLSEAMVTATRPVAIGYLSRSVEEIAAQGPDCLASVRAAVEQVGEWWP